MDGTDASSTNSLLGSIVGDAFQFATPFAQKWLGTTSTPQQLQNQTLQTATLNGSGPNDPTLAKQSPLTITDFLTGGRITGAGSNANQLSTGGTVLGGSLTMIGLVIAAIAVVIVILKR
jgi:uncharacterized membrane protein